MASRTKQPRIPGRYWRIATVAGMASYIDSAALISVALSLAIWQVHYGLTVWMVGLLASGVGFFLAIGALVGGRLGDRFGRQLVFSIDIAVLAVGALVMLLAPSGAVLIIGAAIVGLAAGADLPTSLAVVSDTSPAWARGRLIGFTQVMWTIGIVVTIAIGFGTSTLGYLSTQILLGHIVLAAAVTWVLRLRLARRRVDELPVEADSRTITTSIALPDKAGRRDAFRALLAPNVLGPLLAVGGFYLFWNLTASTFGAYSTYILVNVTKVTQTTATGLTLIFVPVAVVLALVFVRIADTNWRDRVFAVAAVVQVLALLVGAVTGGQTLLGMLVLFALYNVSNIFSGEGNYKVWAQLLFPADVRGTAQGLTFAVVRALCAVFLLFAPVIVAASPAALLWILTASLVLSGAIGIVITRVYVPRLAPIAGRSPELQPADGHAVAS